MLGCGSAQSPRRRPSTTSVIATSFDLFTTADHFALAVNDRHAPVASFLGTFEVRRNPAHVSYVVNPKMDFPAAGTVADHAYGPLSVILAGCGRTLRFG